MPGTAIKRVAIIGAGPAGAISIDALARENKFDVIRVFERREGPGGCWIGDKLPPPTEANFNDLAERTADRPIDIPQQLPAYTEKSKQPRFTESSVYPYLETNIDSLPMEFSQEPIEDEKSQRSIEFHGFDTPFRHWKVIRRYIANLVERKGYQDHISYNTTVEKAEKINGEWKLILRKEGTERDYWWSEQFDAVIVASGHYSVPYIPQIKGLEQLQKLRPGSVIHSKHFRGRDLYKGKNVVVVGASVSAADIAFDLTTVAKSPIHAVMIGHNPNGYFGDEAFNHPLIQQYPSISHIEGRTVHFIDGNLVSDVDHIIFGTGYSWTLPFLPAVPVRNNRVPNLYQHIVWQHDPTLLFVGAVNAGLTFKVFEWQAVFAARLLAGRLTLPPIEEMRKWEEDRVKVRGDGAKFALIFPDFEDYFEELRKSTENGSLIGRQLPKFKREWFRAFLEGHDLRKNLWRNLNEEARKRDGGADTKDLRAKL